MMLPDPARDPAPGSLRRWGIFAAASAGLILSMFYRVSTAMISPALASELRLDSAQLGALAAAFFYAFSFSQIPLGIALDRVGARWTMVALGCTALCGALLFATAQGNGQAVAGRVLLGVGMSCNLMGALMLISTWFPVNRFAFLSGLLVSLGVLGNMAASTPLVLLSRTWGWRTTFFGIAAIHALQILCFTLVTRDRPEGTAPLVQGETLDLGPFKRLLTSFSYWAISLGSFVRYGFFVALQGLWAGPFLMAGLGLEAVAAGNVVLCLSLGYMVGMPLSGRLSDVWVRSRKHVVWPAMTAFALVTFSIALWSDEVPMWLISGTFFAMGVIAATAQVMFAHIKEIMPPEMTARAMTGVNFFVMLGGAAITQILGLFLGHDPLALRGVETFTPIWIFGGSILSLAAFVYLFTPDSRALRPQRGGS